MVSRLVNPADRAGCNRRPTFPRQVNLMSSVALDHAKLDADSRLVSIRLVLATLRLMENWREIADDYDEIMILLTVAAVTGERFTRGDALTGDLRSLRSFVPADRNQYGNMRSIADAIGLNRETVRRKILELVEAGALVRIGDGIGFNPAWRQVDATVELLGRQLQLLVRLVNEMLRDGVAVVR